MKRLRAVKKWKLLFWAVLLLVILALEAFYFWEIRRLCPPPTEKAFP